ncbi:hypothetical protein DLM76_02580 [Leptospira yasudae]|uniref:Lipoprotein n=2 Tax=Leptospira yasudae TaxID=2202201 RepID=A0ABX9M8U2_9LEPT|nr:hypothetical protein [Leptospira yasudae]RHX81587.1 hypothetical protein DLM77_05770 [Leptospira yasudae]RHX95877.1 hypothetical protein DLM76_02580 [Leptospira yasudae]TGK29685.1 hypothetical protein EHQ05_01595 [Leptospira yasudae]TGM07689.1 hypothetical protein EHQ86_06420 [Leptospira yasudae]
MKKYNSQFFTRVFTMFTILCMTVVDCKKENNDSSALMVVAALFASASNRSVSYGGTKSPGDVMTGDMVKANYGSFSFTNLTTNEKISGQVATYSSSPFIALLSAPSYSQGGFAIPIDGVGLLATPISGYSNAGGAPVTSMRAEVYAEKSTNCSDVSGTFNTVQAMFGTLGGSFQGGYGVLTITGTNQKFVSGTITTLGGAGTAVNLNNGICTDGKVVWPTGETAFVSSTGVLILDMGTDKGGFFGLAQDTSINGASVLNGKTFLGFDNLRGANAATVDSFVSGKFACAAGVCTGVNVDARTLSPLNGGNSSTNVPVFTNGISASTTFGTAGGGMPFAMNDNLVIIARTVKNKITIAMLACSTGGCTAASSRHFGLYTEN